MCGFCLAGHLLALPCPIILWRGTCVSSCLRSTEAVVPTIKLPLSSVCKHITTPEVLFPSCRLRQGDTRHRDGSHAPPACLAQLSLQQRISFQPHEVKSRHDRAGNTMTSFKMFSSEAKASLIQATAAKNTPQGHLPWVFRALYTGNPCSTSPHWADWEPFSMPYLTGTGTEYWWVDRDMDLENDTLPCTQTFRFTRSHLPIHWALHQRCCLPASVPG